MTVNLAVVGLGAFGQKHLDAVAQIADAKIQYVAHSKMDVAQEIAGKYGAKAAFTDYCSRSPTSTGSSSRHRLRCTTTRRSKRCVREST
jgi:hypothetical protein